MSVKVRCPCGKHLLINDKAAGKRVKCPACGQILQVLASPGEGPGIAAAGKEAAAAPAKQLARSGDRTASRGTSGATGDGNRAFRSAAVGFAGLALSVGVLLLGLCLFGLSVEVKPEPLVMAGILAGVWLVLGTLAFMRNRWTVILLLAYAYLNFLMFVLFIAVGGTTGSNPQDNRVFLTIGNGGVFVCLMALAQGHKALALSWPSAAPRRLGWLYALALGCFLALLGVESMFAWMTPSLRRFENFGGMKQRVETPYLDAEGERVSGRWAWRYLRDDVPVLGLPVPRHLFLPLAAGLFLCAILLVVRPWRWLARRPPAPLSGPGE